ncbi:MAG: tetratricopeptide repeat protein [Pyrinomonadaceae bacterium]
MLTNACVVAACLCLVLSPGICCYGQSTALEKQIVAGTEALKAGDLETAEKTFSQILRQGVRNALIVHNLGVIAQQRGQHQQAAARFREAILLQPDYAPARLLLGSSLLALGKKSEAVGELKRAVHLLPEEPQARLQLARAYEASDDWPAAVDEYQALVQLAPQEAEYAYQLGKALSKLSAWSYQQIVRLKPDAARLHQSLGQELLMQEKYDRAIAAYKQAARSDPSLPEIQLALALIWLELKKFDDALAAIELELKLVPESKAALETKKKIEAAKSAAAP